MTSLELACVAILTLWLVLASRGRPPRFFEEVALVAVAGLLGEDSCVRGYGFYSYSRTSWSVFVDRAPLLIAAIWPAIVLSARAIARQLAPAPPHARVWHLPAITGAIVIFDAALIEPIAVRAGLWTWTQHGMFSVPVIGIVGWGFFAAAVTACLEHLRGWARGWALVVPALATHAALVASWWGLFRWVLRGRIDDMVATGFILACAAIYMFLVLKRQARLPKSELSARAVATLFFVYLLVLHHNKALIVFAMAFTPPYLALTLLSLAGLKDPPASPSSKGSPKHGGRSGRRGATPSRAP
ncbi:MAG: hypothetical protein JWM74_1072 [Myxococcaceae bacterium]|nr:hypothetical protein [Myxococcaceae bacterium]